MVEKGRKKGVPNLQYTDEGIVNQHGVTFTLEEKKALESAVNQANRKRKQMKETFDPLPRSFGGQPIGGEVKELRIMGQESDFIIAQKTKSLQRFKDHEQYDAYMKYLKRVNNKDYITERTRLYKRNHIAALEHVYGKENVKAIAHKIKFMPQEKYRELVSKDEAASIGYVDSDGVVHGDLEKIRAAFGLPPTNDDYYYDGEEYE